MKKKFKLVDLAVPIFLSSILGIFLNFIDVYVVSKVSDLAASAVGAAGQVTGLFGIVFSVTCGAATILTTQFLGAKKTQRASEIAAVSIAMNTILGLLFSVAVFAFHEQLLSLLGTKEELFFLAKQYLQISGGFLFVDAYIGTLNCIMVSHGETKIQMYLSMAGGIANVFLDAVLVLGLFGCPALGVSGAAYATVFVKLVNALITSLVFFQKIEKPTIFGYLRHVQTADLAIIFKLGIPTIFDSVNYSITQLVASALIYRYLSNTDIIARTYLGNIAMFFQLFTNAIANAGQIMVGHCVGAGDYEGAKQIVNKALGISLVSTGVLSAGACFFSNQLFGIFTSNPDVLRLGFYLLIANVGLELGRAWNVVVIWGLRGAGDVSVPVIICAAMMWIFAVGGTWIVIRVMGCSMLGVWVVFAADELVRAVIMWLRWKGGKWMKMKTVGI